MANEQAKAYIDQATQSLQNFQFQQALDLVDQAIALEPGESDSHVLRGICLSQLGQPDAATEAFRKAITLSPYNSKAYYNLAVHLNSLGQKKEALELAREAVGVDPRHTGARQLQTQIEQELQGVPQAPAGATVQPVLTNDPLATPQAPPTAPPTEPRRDMSPPVGQAQPPTSPYSANYNRPGYAEPAHSLPWVPNLEPSWTVIGWALAALSFVLMIAEVGAVISKFGSPQVPASSMPTMGIGNVGPVAIIDLFIRVLCLLWLIFDIIDRRASWFWVVAIVILGCCCPAPWLVLPIYLAVGRKATK